jgi:hypothetical protein
MLCEIIKEDAFNRAITERFGDELFASGLIEALDYLLAHDPRRGRHLEDGFYLYSNEEIGRFPAFSVVYHLQGEGENLQVVVLDIMFPEQEAEEEVRPAEAPPVTNPS